MYMARAALFCDRTMRHDVAMTGEIKLRGLVLPVGGIIQEKAVQGAGTSLVLLPARNRKDLLDVPESTRAALRFEWLGTVQDAMRAGFASGLALQPRPPFDLQ